MNHGQITALSSPAIGSFVWRVERCWVQCISLLRLALFGQTENNTQTFHRHFGERVYCFSSPSFTLERCSKAGFTVGHFIMASAVPSTAAELTKILAACPTTYLAPLATFGTVSFQDIDTFVEVPAAIKVDTASLCQSRSLPLLQRGSADHSAPMWCPYRPCQRRMRPRRRTPRHWRPRKPSSTISSATKVYETTSAVISDERMWSFSDGVRNCTVPGKAFRLITKQLQTTRMSTSLSSHLIPRGSFRDAATRLTDLWGPSRSPVLLIWRHGCLVGPSIVWRCSCWVSFILAGWIRTLAGSCDSTNLMEH